MTLKQQFSDEKTMKTETRSEITYIFCLSYVVCLSSASNIFPSTGQAKSVAQPKTTHLNQKRYFAPHLISFFIFFHRLTVVVL